jgi:hypothetical protein
LRQDMDHQTASRAERAKWYREKAAECEASAVRTSGSVREAYRVMASEWRRLAEAAERAPPV